MSVNRRDREVLRSLASQVAQIAALPVQQETRALWKALNRLQPVRPMVMIDQVCWHEMDVDGELALQTADPFCRGLEARLRQTLYQWKHMRVDMVVEPVFDIPRVIHNTGFGISTSEQVSVLDPRNSVVGHRYLDQLATEADVARIQIPQVSLDAEATERVEAMAHEVLDGILAVRMQGVFPAFAAWDAIVQWHGVESLLLDMVERPAFMHGIMARLTEAYLGMLDQLEAQGLLGYGQGTIHCSGAHTDELPAPGFQAAHPRPRDLWTCGMAQIFSTVSPAMHQEFELDYANRWYARFGLVYYGCCEPLDDKIGIIRRTPHVRKISMSPWVNVAKGAERIGRDYVFSRKPSPALLAPDSWCPQAVEQDLRATAQCCARQGTPLEFILKDISTVRYQPQRLWEWAQVAMRVVHN
ncbi:MAG: hypothetical protein AB1505_01410 [Candidatus Latescibacterota bacterium]